MLQSYRRQSTIKPFAPILKDRSSRRWDSEISLQTNISLLSISDSSKRSEDDDDDINEITDDSDSSSSQESKSSLVDEPEEHRSKHVADLDPYIFNKHLNGISSTMSNLNKDDLDQSVNELFDQSKSTYQWQNEDYDPRSIRPPPFFQYVKQVRDSRTKPKLTPRRSAHIPVRTTKSEQLKLARQKSASEINSNLPSLHFSTKISQSKLSHRSPIRYPTASPMIYPSRSRTSNHSFRQIQSARSCKEAIDSNRPLVLSSMLIKQMRQDIKNNTVPVYSKSLNSALLREQHHPPFTHQYKMKRIQHWLEKLIPTDYIEYNENASNETTIGTNITDKFDDESDLLSDEKRPNHIERSYAEAHRALPLFKAEIHRKMQRRNLLLTRLELDLYVI